MPRTGVDWVTEWGMPRFDDDPSFGSRGAIVDPPPTNALARAFGINWDNETKLITAFSPSKTPTASFPHAFDHTAGYMVAQVSDPDGPNHQWWYVKSTDFKVERQALINRWIKAAPIGPPVIVGESNFYDRQTARAAPNDICLEGADFLRCIEHHEHEGGAGINVPGPGTGHTGLAREYFNTPGNDKPREVIENLVHSTSDALLKLDVDLELAIVELGMLGHARAPTGNCLAVISRWQHLIQQWGPCDIVRSAETGDTF